MFLRCLSLLCMGVAFAATAHELQDAARGLDVHVEEVAGSVAVNGLALALSRAVGSGVPALADRLIQQWRADSGRQSVLVHQCCGWNMASRIHAGDSRVIQWRSRAAGGELLWSAVDLTSPPGAVPLAAFRLPADCTWTTPIHGQIAGRQFLQHSARCDMDASAAIDLMIRRLASDGWRWQRHGALTVFAERGPAQAQVIAIPASRSSTQEQGRSSLVLVESRSGTGTLQ